MLRSCATIRCSNGGEWKRLAVKSRSSSEIVLEADGISSEEELIIYRYWEHLEVTALCQGGGIEKREIKKEKEKVVESKDSKKSVVPEKEQLAIEDRPEKVGQKVGGNNSATHAKTKRKVKPASPADSGAAAPSVAGAKSSTFAELAASVADE